MNRILVDWKSVWKSWSTWLSAAQLAFLTFIQGFPHEALLVWQQLPEELRSRVPDKVALGLVTVLVLLQLVARHLKQPSKGGSDA